LKKKIAVHDGRTKSPPDFSAQVPAWLDSHWLEQTVALARTALP
jgi:hypothetical protein